MMLTKSSSKPLLRGRVHQIAFYETIILSILSTLLFIFSKKYSFELILYLTSQLILYGVSSTYHITPFKSEKIRRIFQKLDHSSIFILISGTQTSIFLLLKNKTNQPSILTFVFITWSISFIGMMKVFLFNNIFEMIDVIIYIVHGVCVVPFINVLRDSLTLSDIVLYIVGGVLYILGGIVFGCEWPDPCPSVFGYHEVFHVMTVLANLCFMIPILTMVFHKLGIFKG